MKVVRTIAEVREGVSAARQNGARIGFVPTMGAFHDGHLSLMRRARELSGHVIVSLFVNPTQFNEVSDLAQYPRDETRDASLAESAGVDMLFAPPVSELYPDGFSTIIEVSGISEPLEGALRGPRHFRGVATIVAKLLNIVRPDDAFFGQKDAQQAMLIRRMVRDLDFPVRVEVCPTVREADGLAMSSRNTRLDPDSRHRATAISRALNAVADAVASGERDPGRALASGVSILREADIAPEYFTAVSADSLTPLQRLDGQVLVAIAARVGGVRLIDNAILEVASR